MRTMFTVNNIWHENKAGYFVLAFERLKFAPFLTA